MGVAEWFFIAGTKETGPFTLDQMKSLLSSGSIAGETYLWRPGCADWAPLSAFEEFAGLRPPAARIADMNRGDRPQARQFVGVAREEPQAALPSPSQWSDTSPHPWRRYFARILDNLLWGLFISFMIGFVLAAIDPNLAVQFTSIFDIPGGRILDMILTQIFAIIPNALLIGFTGGNLGKWLFGICVLDEANRPIGVARAFKREVRVFVFGLGLAIPIISLITLIMSFQTLRKDGKASWDKDMGLTVVQRKSGAAQYAGFAVGLVLLIGLVAFVSWLNQILS